MCAYKIVMVTSGQPSLNPRLVKEADALAEAGFDVTVIYQYWNDWATVMDEHLLPEKKWKSIRVGGTPKEEKFNYWYHRILHKIGQLTTRKLFQSAFTDLIAIGRCSRRLSAAAKSHPADLYIGHNLAALPAVIEAAKKHRAKAGFDAEDFHRSEISDDSAHLDHQLKARIEKRYLPELDYLTTSSPEIAEKYQELFPNIYPLTILNVFEEEIVNNDKVKTDESIKLVWFSQTIGLNRGLADVIAMLGQVPNLELHFLGEHNDQTIESLKSLTADQNREKIFFYAPIPSTALVQFCSKFDIGLALEPGFSLNNNLALSNKIFTYIQAGLAIIASDTTAQANFFRQYPGIGTVYHRKNLDTLKEILFNYHENPALITAQQANTKSIAQESLNWRVEKEKFLTIVDHTLSTPN